MTLHPGIYVLNGGSASVNFGSATSVSGSGVMFYVTGANYNATSGTPDTSDPPDPFNESPPGSTPPGGRRPLAQSSSMAT